jgi:arylsulfatase A-like enzyme
VPKSFADTFEGKPGMHRREAQSWGAVTENDVQASRAHYYAYTEQLDAQIGRLLAALDASGQSDNTIVVFTSDHGDMVGAHRMWIKGWIPYEECYRVPLIIKWPGHIHAGSRTSALVQTHDLAHTYLALAGAASLPFRDGKSLLPLFQDTRGTDWRDQILCAYYGGEFLYTQRIAITDRYKYVFNGFDFDEMYDLKDDPDELHNRAEHPDFAKHAADMRARLYAMMSQFDDPYGAGGPPVHGGERPDRYGATRYLPRG